MSRSRDLQQQQLVSVTCQERKQTQATKLKVEYAIRSVIFHAIPLSWKTPRFKKLLISFISDWGHWQMAMSSAKIKELKNVKHKKDCPHPCSFLNVKCICIHLFIFHFHATYLLNQYLKWNGTHLLQSIQIF